MRGLLFADISTIMYNFLDVDQELLRGEMNKFPIKLIVVVFTVVLLSKS